MNTIPFKKVTGFPPNYKAICKVLPEVANRPKIIFTYGDTLYIPNGELNIPYHLVAHERTHVRQQLGMGVLKWWRQYLKDPAFRLSQEGEAYSNQYRAMSKPDKERYIRKLAGDLCSPMYGGIVTFEEAKRLIRTPVV